MTCAEFRPGDPVTFHWKGHPRAMQRCEVLTEYRCGDLGLRFPDNARIRCQRQHVTKVTAPQHEPMW